MATGNIGKVSIAIGADSSTLSKGIKEAKDIISIELSEIQKIAIGLGADITKAMKLAHSGIKAMAASFDGANISASDLTSGVGNFLASMKPVNDSFKGLQSIAVNGLNAISESMSDLNFSVSDLLNPLALGQLGMDLLGKSGVLSMSSIIKYTTKAINYFIDFYNNSLLLRFGIEAIKFGFIRVWETAKLVFRNLKEGFSTIGRAIEAIYNGDFTSIGQIFIDGFKNIVEDIKDTSISLAEKAGEGMRHAITNRLNNITESDVEGFISRFQGIGEKANEVLVAALIPKELISIPEPLPTQDIPTSLNSENNRQVPEINNDLLDFYRGIQAELDVATNKQKVFGDEFNLTAEKTKILNDSITSLLEDGISPMNPVLQLLLQQLGQLNERANSISISINEVLQGAVDNFMSTLGEAIISSESFGSGFTKVFDGVFNVISGIMENLGKTAIKTGVTIEAMKKSFLSFGGLGSIAAGAALLVFARLVKQDTAKIPALASGGLAFSETLALVGDNRNASVDPEVIAPLSKLKQYLGDSGGGVIIPELRLDGDDLVVAFNRAQARRSSFGQ